MTDTAVVGAGIGGLATGTLLARAGCDVTIYEQRPSPAGIGAALCLQPNGLAVIDALGVLDVLAAAGSELRRLRLFDDRLQVISDVDVPGGSRHGYALVVARDVLIGSLVDAATAAGVTIETGQRVLALSGRPAAPVIELEHTPRTCDLVVGADGAGSVVRPMVAPGLDEGHDAGRPYVRALVEWVCSEQLAGEYWTRRGLAGLLPCGDGMTYWYASATDAITRAVEDEDVDRIRRAVSVAHPPLVQVVSALTSPSQIRLDRVRQVEVGQLYRGVAVLVGDAAHTIAPTLAQGASSALVDAGVLASELGRRDVLADALAAYDARRCPAVHRVQRDAEWLARTAHFTRGRRVRNAGLRLVPDRFTVAATRRAQQVDLAGFRAELKQLP
jgi:2-polyprenyl-6-methoxyphenol hydroxylase-like FAD-dependent oxidoreductase